MTYPLLAEEADDRQVREAMVAAGLGHLAGRLDEEAEWSTVLSGGEQQRVGFARALIHRPTILLLDEAVSTLEEAEARALYELLAAKLPDTIVISTGRSHAARRPARPHHRDDRLVGGRPPATSCAGGRAGVTARQTAPQTRSGACGKMNPCRR